MHKTLEIKAPTVRKLGHVKTIGPFEEYLGKIESLLKIFQEATRVPVRLFNANTGFEFPHALHETCQRFLEHSDTALECMGFHKKAFTSATDSQAMHCSVCPCGLHYGLMTIKNSSHVLARVEVGPVEPDDGFKPALRVLDFIVSQLQEKAEEFTQHVDRPLPKFLCKAIKHIEANIHQSLTLTDTARTSGLSPDRFSRVFREHTGKTFSMYVAELRVERACGMLINSPHTRISEIAMDCGFGSIPYFNRLFIRHTGLSPGRFRMRKTKVEYTTDPVSDQTALSNP